METTRSTLPKNNANLNQVKFMPYPVLLNLQMTCFVLIHSSILGVLQKILPCLKENPLKSLLIYNMDTMLRNQGTLEEEVVYDLYMVLEERSIVGRYNITSMKEYFSDKMDIVTNRISILE